MAQERIILITRGKTWVSLARNVGSVSPKFRTYPNVTPASYERLRAWFMRLFGIAKCIEVNKGPEGMPRNSIQYTIDIG